MNNCPQNDEIYQNALDKIKRDRKCKASLNFSYIGPTGPTGPTGPAGGDGGATGPTGPTHPTESEK